MKRLSVIAMLLLLLVCNLYGCGQKYAYSHKEYLENIQKIEMCDTELDGDAGDDSVFEETDIDFSLYQFNSSNYKQVYIGFNESIGDDIFSLNGFDYSQGLTTFYIHSSVALDNFKLSFKSNDKVDYLELPYLPFGVTKVQVPASTFTVINITGEESDKTINNVKVKKCGQLAYKVKKSGIYLFMHDGIVLKSSFCEKNKMITAPSNTNNVLIVE